MNRSFLALIALAALITMSPVTGWAHCDGIDGPVVGAARQALESGNLNQALIWVRPANESAVRRAFERSMAVRKLGPEAKELADTYFFETLVRIHRAGEGAPYTGLKPAGRDLGPAIPAADQALRDGKVAPVLKLLTEAAESGARQHFEGARSRSQYDPNDVAAGRRYVEAYVSYVHYVEGVYRATQAETHGHPQEHRHAE